MNRIEDCLGLGRRVDHVGGALASLLPRAHIDDRQRKGRGLHNAGRGIADHAVHLFHQAPIGNRIEIHEDAGIGARFGQGARPFDERVTARIRVGIDTDQLSWSSGKGREKCVRFRICVLENSHWMPRSQHGWLSEIEIQSCFEFCAIEQCGTAQMIERWRASPENPARLFAHRDYALPCGGRRGEMKVSKLCERVAHLVVDRALRNLASFNVRDGNAQCQSYRSRSQHLVPVGDEQQNVGTPCRECIGKPENRNPDRLGHAGVGVGTEQAFNACLNRKSVAFDFLEREPEFRGKMRTQREDAQIDFGVGRELAQRPVQVAVIGARRSNDADAALAAFLAHDRSNLRANLIHEQYRWVHEGLVRTIKSPMRALRYVAYTWRLTSTKKLSTGREQGSEPSLPQGKRLMHRIGAFALFFSTGIATALGAPAGFDADAVRLNNRGVAQMGQQFTDRAAATFADAFKKDPKLAQAAINEGIALMTLQKLDEAKSFLQKAIALDPNNPQAWYNLGLAQHAGNELDVALASFQRAVKLDPRDADSYYFVGVCYAEMKDFDKAIPVFEAALKIDPLHASSEFQLARALQRSGQKDEVKDHFKRFSHLTSTKIGAPIGLAYGEQGHYSTVTPIEEPESSVKAMIPVKLEATALTAGDKSFATSGGACMMDVTGSGKMDLVLMETGAQAIRVLKARGDGTFEAFDAAAAGLKASGHAVACAVGDYDGDGLNDLAVALDDQVLLFKNLGKGKFQDATAEAGIIPRNKPSGITFIDYDHDGDLDLLLTGAPLKAGDAPNVLWRNNGNKTFTEWTDPTGLGGSGTTSAAILTDFNNDRAVDIAVTGDSPAPLIYINPREGKYPTQPIYENSTLPATTGIAVLDYNKDGWMDIAVTHAGAPGLTLWRNVEGPEHIGRRFERVDLPLEGALRGWGLTAVDIDNDGWLDLAAIVETKAGPQVRVLRNRGDGTFEDASHALGLDQVKLQSPRGLIAADVDGDGAPDLIVTQVNAPPVVLRNIGANKNHFVRLDLTGYADNKTAIGAKVETFANGHWQKWELAGASGYQTQSAPQLLIGLGSGDGVDLLRILWPTGVLQDEIDLPKLVNGRTVIAMKEADRRGSSCPVLFAWDGHKYRLVTDVIGAAVVGHWFTPQRRNIPNPGEWIKVDGSQVEPVNGRLSMRFMEPMEEVNYIDQLRLVAVDHPENVEVNPDERFLDDPPFASGHVIASTGTHLPVGAWDGAGRDVLDVLRKADHTFASGFTPTPYDGFANLHPLTLDLGSVDSNAPLRLLMTGYVNYFSATSLYGAWQAGIKPVSPYVEAQLPDGTWQRIVDDAGFPAGLERTIVVDLTGKLPAGARKIRLTTNLEIYWDQVLIDNQAQAQAQTAEVPLALATLRFRGYPKQIDLPSNGDLDYDYDRVSLTGPYQHQRGDYTRFGDVTPLVKGIDDRYAIFGSGEEIAAEFDIAKLPALRTGWKRDYFFYANGYVKDMDWWDASPFTVSQLPFHKMSTYPYPANEKFPEDAGALEYQLNWNNRWDSGEPVRSYHFNFQTLHSTPAEDTPPADAQADDPTVHP